MLIETVNYIKFGESDEEVHEGEKIKIWLSSGEILIGEYQNSDFSSLTIDREYNDIEVEFKDIVSLEKIVE